MNPINLKNSIRRLLGLFLSFLIYVTCFSQTLSEKTLFSIDNVPVNAGEFMRIYKKNSQTGQETQPTSVNDYLKLYIKFKLKVHEAEMDGYDTLPAFRKELNGYRDQLAKPYLTNQQTIDSLTREAYKRMQIDIDASHILIRVAKDAPPEDTLKAYQKILQIRERLLRGEDFEKVARATSDDPSVRNNGGHLGYFTVFQMVYPFEKAAYHLKAGEVSLPVRTRFGYHLIKVLGTRKDPGSIKVAHIMIAVPRGSGAEKVKEAMQKATQIYTQLKEGADFGTLAKKYSDDYNSAKNNGELPWFSTGRMIPEFANAAFNLQTNGEISPPVKTGYGWHIIKRLDQKNTGSYEEEKSGIEKKILAGDRAQQAKNAFYLSLKKQYKFWIDYTKLAPLSNHITPDNFFEKNWVNDPALQSDGLIFGFKGHQYTLKDVVHALEKNFKSHPKTKMNEMSIREAVNHFANKELLAYANSELENNYPDFAYLMKEYHDGMLLFDISDKRVWSKAVQDTAGLQEFYNMHSGDYIGGKRLEIIDFSIFDPKKTREIEKVIQKGKRKGRKINFYRKNFPPDTSKNILVSSVILEAGISSRADSISWKKGAEYRFSENGISHIWLVGKPLNPAVKPLTEVRGLVTSDFQNYLEKKWVNYLKEKYPVKIDQEVLKEVKIKLSQN